jgi:hypothetical protein
MHRIKMYHLRRKVHFVIMASVFDTPAQINTIYDLKGSLVGRHATQTERESGGVLKDCDLVDDHRKFHLGKKRRPFLQQLQRDAKFLASLQIMDYSLLVGVHDRAGRQLVGRVEVPHHHNAESAHSHSVAESSTLTTTTTTTVPGTVPDGLLQQHSANVGIEELHAAVTLSPSHNISSEPTSAANSISSATSAETGTGTGLPSDAEGGVGAHHVHGHNHHLHAHLTVNAATGATDSSTGEAMPLSSIGSRSNTPFRRAQASHSTSSGAPSPTHEPHSQLQHQQQQHQQQQHHMLSPISEDEDKETVGIDRLRSSGGSMKKKQAQPQSALTVSALSGAPEMDARSSGSECEELLEDEEDSAAAAGEDEEEEEDDFDEDEVEYVYDEVDAGDSDAEGNPATDARLHPANGEHFGNGITFRAPWTTRLDGGINSHSGARRLDEIYFIGIIDILQEYNTSKKVETMLKVRLSEWIHS